MTQQTRYYVRRFYENQILINKINDITILLIISVPFERRLQRSGELRTAQSILVLPVRRCRMTARRGPSCRRCPIA